MRMSGLCKVEMSAFMDGLMGPFRSLRCMRYRGDSDKSFEWLEPAYKQRDPGLTDMKTDPLFKSLRDDPRYTDFLKRMRLPT
jgi:hypothetical protein